MASWFLIPTDKKGVFSIVFAEKPTDHFRVFLTEDDQMEQYLASGASLYVTDGSHEELLATPEDGFLIERPILLRTGESNGQV